MLQKTSIGDPGVAPRDDLATSIAAIPANARQRKIALTLAAWWPTLIMACFFNDIRFSAGWYLGRIYALFAGSSLLVVLLTETLLLHRRYEQHQRQLIAELDHRVKNVLAEVAAVGRATRQGSRSIGEFLGSLDGRIQSMGAAHTLLSKSGWHSVRLDALVRSQLAPYMTGANITIGGPDAMLPSAGIQALSRALHELATNAAKYGALSIPGGQLSLSWDLKPDGAPTNLTSGASLAAPRRQPRSNPATAPISYATSFLTNSVAGSISRS